MTKIKICGLREAVHAVAAAEAGADFLGFVFVPGVRRELSEPEAAQLIDRYRQIRGEGGPKLVGLFANQPVREVIRIAGSCGLDLVQLCGDEAPEYWKLIDVPVIRQLKVPDSGPINEVIRETLTRVEEVICHGCVPVLDRREAGELGGTGRRFDWAVARDIARGHKIVLAGGLSPENAAEAVAMVRPWGVDVSSGVETNGVKDLGKISAFADEVRRADREVRDPHERP